MLTNTSIESWENSHPLASHQSYIQCSIVGLNNSRFALSHVSQNLENDCFIVLKPLAQKLTFTLRNPECHQLLQHILQWTDRKFSIFILSGLSATNNNAIFRSARLWYYTGQWYSISESVSNIDEPISVNHSHARTRNSILCSLWIFETVFTVYHWVVGQRCYCPEFISAQNSSNTVVAPW